MAYNSNAISTVYDFIVEKIHTGEWQADTKILSELKLAKQLGVSRVAVRDAIQKLVGMSVLRKVQGSGTYVEKVDLGSILTALMPIVSISDDELLEIMEFRTYFEPGNVRQFIRNASAEEMAALESYYEKLNTAREDPEAFHILDYEFHHHISKGTKNSFVIRISNFYMDILKEQQRCISTRLGPAIALEDHLLILKYMKEKHEDLAALHMENHVKRAIASMKAYLARTASSDRQDSPLWVPR